MIPLNLPKQMPIARNKSSFIITRSVRIILLLLVLVSFKQLSIAQRTDISDLSVTLYDLTKTDATQFEDVRSLNLMIFGIKLGMSPDEVQTVILSHPKLKLKADPFNTSRQYLYDPYDGELDNIPIAYFIFDNYDSILTEIILYQSFSRYLTGDSKKLLSSDVFNKNSSIITGFLGLPEKREHNLDVPSIGLSGWSYYYPEKGFKINRIISGNSISQMFSFYLNNFSKL